MKRKLSIIMAMVIALSLTACDLNQAQNADTASGQNGKASSAEAAATQETSWDLSAIYSDKAAFEREYSQIEAQIETISALRGRLNTVDGVVGYYAGLDKINRLAGRLDAYTWLQVQKDQSDSNAKALVGQVSNLFMQVSTDIAFALPELFANSDSFLDEVAGDPRMKPYLIWFQRDRARSEHTLPEREEQLLQPLYQLQDGAYNLYDSMIGSDLTFPNIKFPDGTEAPADENHYAAAFNKDYSQEFRIEYYNAMMQTYGAFRNTFAQNLHNYYTAVTQSASIHKYGSALEADLALVDTPISVYNGVLNAAENTKPSLDRYFALLRNSLGTTKLYNFETNASIAKDPGTTFAYRDAQTLVKEALAPLGDDYAKQLDVILESGAIDVYPGNNKSTGAFAISVPDTHPYILLNYTDDYNSVSVLAHELGHAVHILYSQTQESSYNQNASSLVSEVTSALNEMLLSDYLIQNARTEEERQYYAAEQLSTLYGSFFTQAFFARFQEAAVREVENGGTLTADKLDELWLETTRDCYGPEYAVTDSYATGWARIPHFYSGFYVYQYAVGISAACNIADRIQAGDADAVEDYLMLLKAGDSGNVVDLLNLAGVDLSNGNYINAFTARFERLITEFEDSEQ